MKINPLFVLPARGLASAVTNNGKDVVSSLSSANTIVAALPVTEPAIALVTCRSVNQPLVTRVPVTPMLPDIVMLPAPKANVGLLIVVVPATEDPMFMLVVEPAAPPVPRFTVLVTPVAVAFVE